MFHALIFIFLILPFASNGASVEVLFEPKDLPPFRSDTLTVIAVSLRSNESWTGSLNAWCLDDDICTVDDGAYDLDLNAQNGYTSAFNLSIYGKFLGHTTLHLQIDNDSKELHLTKEEYKLTILRSLQGEMLDRIFTVVVTIVVIFNTFLMGTQLDLNTIIKVLKRPIGPVIAFFCQYVLMPTLGFILSWFLLPEKDYAMRLALFVVSCSPGGGKSNFWTILFDGNIDLCITMTFLSTVSALGMMPLWLSTLGTVFSPNRIPIPFFEIVRGLIALLIPSVAGMLFIRFRPGWEKKIHKIIKVTSFVFLVVFSVFGLFANFFIFQLITWRTVLASATLPWFGYILAFSVAYLLRQGWKDSITIAIETGIHNIGIAIIILRFSLPEPDRDLAMVMPISVVFLTGKPLLVTWIVRSIYHKYFKTKDGEETMIEPGKEVQISDRKTVYATTDLSTNVTM
uniref:Solute carrier family 10 member 6 n=1 Tax=Plectus sambesii TaxID=2011161 RepID=A0A914VCB4_9BILA